MATKKKPAETPSFEEQLTALDELVTRMEQGGLPLRDMLAGYEQGVQMADALDKELTGVQARLEVLRAGQTQEKKEQTP